MLNLILSIFFTFNVSAQVAGPESLEESHPGSGKSLLQFQRTEIKDLRSGSALYLPNRPDGRLAPLVVFGHGQAIGEDSYDATFEHLAGKGIAVLYVKYDNGFFDQNWRRMASDWNEITTAVINSNPQKIDGDKIIYSGHSKGAYVGLMAAGAPNAPYVGAVHVFAPAGYDSDYLKALNSETLLSIYWGERDSIIDKSDNMQIYNEATVDRKQFVELVSYPNREADHYYPMNKGSFFGGQDGVSAFHYHGVWKWLVAAAWDLEAGAEVTQEYVYGDKTATTGEAGLQHNVIRNWSVRSEYLFKVKPTSVKKKSLTQLLNNSRSLGHQWYKAVLSQKQALQISQRSEVQYLGKNHKLKTLVEPNDLHHNQWAFKSSKGFDINALKAWDLSVGAKDIVVAVVDSGIKYTHSDLKDNLWVNEAEKNGKSGEDDDGNGYIDDIHGYNFAVKNGNGSDNRGHGTMVSGLIGAVGNNGRGITGMAWNVQMMSLNMFPNFWGSATLESALAAINYAVDNNAQIINASWGQADEDLEPDEGFKILEEAIQRASDKGILFVAAAGNSGNDNDVKGMVPATLPVDNILSVGAYNSSGMKWSKTNYGETNVDVMAPGEGILTTHPDGTRITSGTSLSAPIVTGLAVLMLDMNPNLKAVDIKEILIKSCVANPELKQLSRCQGHLDAEKALQLARDSSE